MPDRFSQYGQQGREAEIVWEGDTHEVICGFPKEPRGNLGHALHLVQLGLTPHDSKPVPGTDRGVYELRDEDERAWYRVVYLKKIGDKVHVLHCFEKRTNQIAKRDLETINARLTRVKERLREAVRDEKRKGSTPAAQDKRKRPR